MKEDPLPALLEMVRSGANSRVIDRWAIRRLAIMKDERAIPALAEALALERLVDEERIEVAAALAWFGKPAAEVLDGEALPAQAAPIVEAALQLARLR
ncbi:MAG TPA: hypothetical protein VIK52_12180 [Opitutaceae bacterium]